MGFKLFTAIICFLHFLLLPFHFGSALRKSLCHEHERWALLHFKQRFLSKKWASDPFVYSKLQSWNLSKGEGGNCCSWDGVQCDGNIGYVVDLNLESSGLYGSIDSNCSLFHLAHLRSLNLAYNYFNSSQIPSGLGRLGKLTHPNLSDSDFSGQMPSQVLEFSELVSLDLSGNPSTKLHNPSLRSLVQNLTSLQELHLDYVNISSAVPDIMANLSSLKSLRLGLCGLHGEFLRDIFSLPNLQCLSLNDNLKLTGCLPKFHKGSRLQELELSYKSFSGDLPNSIGNLNSLKSLRPSRIL